MAPLYVSSSLRRSLAGGLVLAASLLGGSAGVAAEPVPSEQALQAAYLFNFTKFVEWPPRAFPAPGAPIRIGILGQDPFGKLLDAAIKDRTVNGRPVTVERFESLKVFTPVHILYIASGEAAHLADILKAAGAHPLLTVSSIPDFATGDGMIQFVMEGKKIRLHINLKNALTAGLKISAQLLKIARIIERQPPGAP